MTSARERWNEFVNQGGAYALNTTDLIAAGTAVSSNQSGPGGSNMKNVWLFNKGDNADPNGKVYVPNTEQAFCISADTQEAWTKTDGLIGNTGWVAAGFSIVP